MTTPPTAVRQPLTSKEWLICVMAALGFAFDIYELLMLPLIVRPALLELLGIQPGSPEFNRWVGLLFYVPALAGGVFGLLGGYLTDLFGRRRVLVWSILLYAFSALAAGFATSAPALLFFRTTTFIGVCVEFVAAVAWLAELFPDAAPARVGARLHAGVLVARRDHGHGGVFPRRDLRRRAARHPRRARAVAVHADLGRDPRAAPDRHPAVPARSRRRGGRRRRRAR